MSISTDDVQEFARFGPWIDQVRTAEDLPRLFRDRGIRLENARLALKIPRDIPRRDAAAGMNLYDHVLVVHEDGLDVFSRVDTGDHTTAGTQDAVHRQFVAAGDLLGTSNAVDLLAGELTLFTLSATPLRIRYNGSSAATITLLCETLASFLQPAVSDTLITDSTSTSGISVSSVRDRLRNRGLDLVAEYAAFRKSNPASKVIFAQPRARIKRAAHHRSVSMAALTDAVSPTVAYEILGAANPGTLTVFSRGRWVGRAAAPVHSITCTTLCLTRVERIELAQSFTYPDLVVAQFQAGINSWSIQAAANTGAHDFLKTLAGKRR